MKESSSNMDLDKLRKMFLDVNKLEQSSHNINSSIRKIYEIFDDKWESRLMRIYVHSRLSKNVNNPIVQDLLNYLSIHEFTPKYCDETNVNKTTFYIDIIEPLFEQLNKNEIERASKNENINQPCDLNEHDLLDVVENQINLCIHKKQGINKVKLICTSCPIELQEIDEIIFLKNDNITAKIRKWGKNERAIYASQFDNHTFWVFDPKSPVRQESFIEIEYEFPQKKYHGIKDKSLLKWLFRILDLFKWAIIIASKNPYPIKEGSCIITIDDFERLDIHQRDENPCMFLKGHNIIITKKIAEIVIILIEDFCSTSKEFDDLWDALWFFGRASIATLDRDRLIDSVIGLECLLVPNHGESTYRFSLHGASILSTQWKESKVSVFETKNDLFYGKENLFKWFQLLYRARSTSVHTAKEEVKFANSAVYALAVIIAGIIYLKNNDLLDKKQGKLAKAVEKYVKDKIILEHVD